MGRSGIQVAACLAFGAALLPLPTYGQDEEQTSPFDSGLIEQESVSLLLLDVVATDEDGRPMPGLKKEDFTVQINGRVREIYSLDDLCSPEPVATASVGNEPSPDTKADEPPVVDLVPGASLRESVRYILYFDFSQLGAGRRHEAMCRVSTAASRG